jgi:hypothetical protein
MRALAGLLLLAGCLYQPTPRDGALTCAPDPAHACPSGYYCATTGTCYRMGHSPAGVDGSVDDLSVAGTHDLSGITPDLAPAICADGQRDGDETGVDCGGTCPTKCGTGKGCLVGADCMSGFCNTSTRLCVDSSCGDGVLDGTETDVDCGGSCASKCKASQACKVDADCVDNTCDQKTSKCVSTQCQDDVQDGKETDIDCGGPSCVGCALTKKCLVDGDCASGTYCHAKTLTCVADRCSDGKKDGDESDVDCGGSCAHACGDGSGCSGPHDCTGGVCTSGSMCCTPSGDPCSGKACGTAMNNCGQTKSCGTNGGGCAQGLTCNASQQCVCVDEPATTTCSGKCGNQPNNCGKTVACSCDSSHECTAQFTCCLPAGDPCGSNECGTAIDNCGISKSCGTHGGGCASGFTCNASTKKCDCVPNGMACAGGKCGTQLDNCGNSFNCTCGNSQECDTRPTVHVCCTPSADPCAGLDCGSAVDSCGVTRQCGTHSGGCLSGWTCNASQKCVCNADPVATTCGTQCGVSVTNNCGTPVACSCSGSFDECTPSHTCCIPVSNVCDGRVCGTINDSCGVAHNCICQQGWLCHAGVCN